FKCTRNRTTPCRIRCLASSPHLSFFPPSFQSLPDPKSRILPAPMLPSNRRDACPTQTPRPRYPRRLHCHPIPIPSHCWKRPGHPPVCVTKSPAIPATQSGKGIYLHTRNTPSSRGLRHKTPGPIPARPLRGTLPFQLWYSEISTCAGTRQRSSRSAYLPVERSGPRRQLSYQGSGKVAWRGQAGAASEKYLRKRAGAVMARADGLLPAGEPRTGKPGFLRVDPLAVRPGDRLSGNYRVGFFRGSERVAVALRGAGREVLSPPRRRAGIASAGGRGGQWASGEGVARRDVFFVLGGAAVGVAAGIACVPGMR